MGKINACMGLILLISLGLFQEGCYSGRKIEENKKKVKALSESERSEYQYALTEATKQKIFGNFKEAIILYEKCIKVNELSDVAHYQIGGIKMMMGEYEDAKIHTKKAIGIGERNFWYMMQLAQLYNIENQIDSLRLTYEKIVQYWPEKIEVKIDLARLLVQEGEYEKAMKILNGIENEKGISETISLLKEQIFVQTGRKEQAIEELKKLIELMPEEIRYIGILAELYSSMDKNREAEELYEKIFSIDPENPLALLSYSEFKREQGEKDEQFQILEKVYKSKTITLDQKLKILIDYLTDDKEFENQKNEIKHLIDILLEDYPDNYKVRTAYADYLVKVDKYEEALKEYEYVLNVEKGNYFIWEQVLYIENLLGDTENLYRRSGEALKYFPEKPILYLFRGNSAMWLERNEEAVETLEKGLKKVKNNNPLKLQFYTYLAEACNSTGDNEKSDEYFELALEMDKNNLLLLNNYSYYLSLREEKLDVAEKMSRKTIMAEPENSTYLDTYAWIMFKRGNYKKACEYIEKSIASGGGEDPEILEHYGDILEKLGKKKEAVKYWKLSLEKGNNGEKIIEKIRNAQENE
jgi:tetratricopeptide (TPR) repeat protein